MYKVMQRHKREDIKRKKTSQNDNVIGARYYFPEQKPFGALAYIQQLRSCDKPVQRYPIQFTKDDSIIRIEKLLNKKNSQGSGDIVLKNVLISLLRTLTSGGNALQIKKEKGAKRNSKQNQNSENQEIIQILRSLVNNEETNPWEVLTSLSENQLEGLELTLANFQNFQTTLHEIYHVGFDNLTEKYFAENFKKHHFASNYEEALKISRGRTDTSINTVLCEFQRDSFMKNEYETIENSTTDEYTTTKSYYFWQFDLGKVPPQQNDILYKGKVILRIETNSDNSNRVYHLGGTSQAEDAKWTMDDDTKAKLTMQYLCQEMHILAGTEKQILNAIASYADKAHEMLKGNVRNESVMAGFFGQVVINFLEAAATYSREDFSQDVFGIPYRRDEFVDFDRFLEVFEDSMMQERVKRYFEIHEQADIYAKMGAAFYEFKEKYNNESVNL